MMPRPEVIALVSFGPAMIVLGYVVWKCIGR